MDSLFIIMYTELDEWCGWYMPEYTKKGISDVKLYIKRCKAVQDGERVNCAYTYTISGHIVLMWAISSFVVFIVKYDCWFPPNTITNVTNYTITTHMSDLSHTLFNVNIVLIAKLSLLFVSSHATRFLTIVQSRLRKSNQTKKS